MIDLLAAAIIGDAPPQLAPIDTTTVIEEDSVDPTASRCGTAKPWMTCVADQVPRCPTVRSRYPVTTAIRTAGPAGSTARPRAPDRRHGDRGTAITQLNPRNLGATVRATNERLMVTFINADPPSRVGLDVRKSVVVYDGNFLFNYAMDGLPQ